MAGRMVVSRLGIVCKTVVNIASTEREYQKYERLCIKNIIVEKKVSGFNEPADFRDVFPSENRFEFNLTLMER